MIISFFSFYGFELKLNCIFWQCNNLFSLTLRVMQAKDPLRRAITSQIYAWSWTFMDNILFIYRKLTWFPRWLEKWSIKYKKDYQMVFIDENVSIQIRLSNIIFSKRRSLYIKQDFLSEWDWINVQASWN